MRITTLLCGLVFFLAQATSSFAEPEPKSVSRWFDFRVMPIGMVSGEFMGDLSISPISILELGVIGYTVNGSSGGNSIKGSGYGGRLSLHFSFTRNDTCWFLSAYYYEVPSLALHATSGGEVGSTTFTAGEGGLLLGKMWVWSSGFEMSLAFGVRGFTPGIVAVPFPSGVKIVDSSASVGKIEYTLGWVF